MSVTHYLNQTWSAAGRSEAATITEVGDAEIYIPGISVTGADVEITCVVAAADIKMLWINSDQDVTLETNDGTTPDQTFSLVANVPLVWSSDMYHSNPITDDLTALFFSKGANNATVDVAICTDATP